MKIKFRIATVLLILNFGSNLIFGQQESCGTAISADQRIHENTFTITDNFPAQSLPQIGRTLSFTVFVVKGEDGSETDNNSINSAIEKLNNYFSPIALKFKICNIITIENYQYDKLKQGENEKDLLIQYYQAGTINLYLVKTLLDLNLNPASGFSYMSGDGCQNAIFLNKSYLNTTELAHQTGHFFDLYHTHESEAFGGELVNGYNCTSSGDRVCDTNADPNLKNLVKDGVYTGSVKDANNDMYSPSPKNMMSYGPDNIRCLFSRGQFLRIVYSLNNFRKDLR